MTRGNSMNKKLFVLSLLTLLIEQGSMVGFGGDCCPAPVPAVDCCPQPRPACCPRPVCRKICRSRICCPKPFFRRACGPVCRPRIRRICASCCPVICRPKPVCCPRIRCCRPKPVCCPQPLPVCPPAPCVQPTAPVEYPQPTCPTGNCPVDEATGAPEPYMQEPMGPEMTPSTGAPMGDTAADTEFTDFGSDTTAAPY
jgi:hypothetical protein